MLTFSPPTELIVFLSPSTSLTSIDTCSRFRMSEHFDDTTPTLKDENNSFYVYSHILLVFTGVQYSGLEGNLTSYFNYDSKECV